MLGYAQDIMWQTLCFHQNLFSSFPGNIAKLHFPTSFIVKVVMWLTIS